MKKKNIVVFMVLSAVVLLLLLPGVIQGRDLLIDRVVKGLFSNVPDSLDPIFIAITHLGDKKGVGITALIMLVWFLFKRRDYFAMGIFALAVAFGNELNKFLKVLIGRERPSLEHLVQVKSLSFPSGHAMVSSILYIMIAFFLLTEYKDPAARRVIVGVAAAVVLLIGASRIILNVHYPSDIFGGYAFGFLWSALFIFVYEKLRDAFPMLKTKRERK
ncbi:PAP2 family protein [Neobacillus piezotolerans]|uniref:PAP2 family protein n=1 Tax=Neobacillus piezotolerans TaxID=2259171 RepID=A0A3D8GLS8_9BACI|nr:phosphatase PAP2 family protein [Neobacillus piezotolerans]RDU35292.1 PAP2 family protein [Neobacillus piezotolerans]